MFINTLSWLYFCFCANTNITPSQVETTKFNFFKNNLDLNQTRNTGLDERVSIMSDIIQDTEINYELLASIDENFYKKNVLDILKNDNIPLIQKMNTLNRYLLYIHDGPAVNLFAGGLLDDWEFEIK